MRTHSHLTNLGANETAEAVTGMFTNIQPAAIPDTYKPRKPKKRKKQKKTVEDAAGSGSP